VSLLWTATWSSAHQIMFCVARDMTVRKLMEYNWENRPPRVGIPIRSILI
jgi:hypothetical protein